MQLFLITYRFMSTAYCFAYYLLALYVKLTFALLIDIGCAYLLAVWALWLILLRLPFEHFALLITYWLLPLHTVLLITYWLTSTTCSFAYYLLVTATTNCYCMLICLLLTPSLLFTGCTHTSGFACFVLYCFISYLLASLAYSLCTSAQHNPNCILLTNYYLFASYNTLNNHAYHHVSYW